MSNARASSSIISTGTRIVVWGTMLGVVGRGMGDQALGVVSLTLAWIGVLSLPAPGLADATRVAVDRARSIRLDVLSADDVAQPALHPILEYVHPRKQPRIPATPEQHVFINALYAAIASAIAVAALYLLVYLATTSFFPQERNDFIWDYFQSLQVVWIGIILRILIGPESSVIRSCGSAWVDTLITAGSEVIWLGLLLVSLAPMHYEAEVVGEQFVVISVLIFVAKFAVAARWAGDANLISELDSQLVSKLLRTHIAPTLLGSAEVLWMGLSLTLLTTRGTATIAAYTPGLIVGLALHWFGLVLSARWAGRERRVPMTLGALSLTALLVWLYRIDVISVWLTSPPAQGAMLETAETMLGWALLQGVIAGTTASRRSVLIGSGKQARLLIVDIASLALSLVLAYVLLTRTRLGVAGVAVAWFILTGVRCAVVFILASGGKTEDAKSTTTLVHAGSQLRLGL